MPTHYNLPTLPKIDTLQNINIPAVTRRQTPKTPTVNILPVNVTPIPDIVNSLKTTQTPTDTLQTVRDFLQSISPVEPQRRQFPDVNTRLQNSLRILTMLANLLQRRLGYIPEPLSMRTQSLQTALETGNPVKSIVDEIMSRSIEDAIRKARGNTGTL